MRDEIDTICKTIRRAAIFQENFNGDFDVTQFEADKLPLSATPHLLSFVAKSNDLDSMSTLFQLLKKRTTYSMEAVLPTRMENQLVLVPLTMTVEEREPPLTMGISHNRTVSLCQINLIPHPTRTTTMTKKKASQNCIELAESPFH